MSASYSWAGVAMSLSSAGLATVMVQRIGAIDDRRVQRALVSYYGVRALAASLTLAALVAAFGAPALVSIFGPTIDRSVAVPAAIAGAMWSQVAIAVAALNGCHRARAASGVLAACGLLQGGAMTVAMIASDRPLVTAWAIAAGSAAAATIALLRLRRLLGGGLLGARSEAPPPPAVSIWASPVLWHTLASAAVLPVGFFASAFVARGPDGTHQLALYFALEQIYQVVVYLPAVMGQTLLPMVARRLHARADAERRLMRRLTRLALLAAAIGLVLAALLGSDAGALVHLLHNPVVQPADAWALRWMVAAASLAFSLSMLGGAMLGRGQIMRAGQLNLMWAVLFVGTTLALGSHGTAGLQCARACAAVVLIGATSWLLRKPAARGSST
ncbi:MAG: hypothetical protein KGJ30_00835 [Burkholderiales bacterium]|nr:hypothetical protein [Burkholderiales bacterium]MDE2157436.1 hypothetical protein [Burkholderiales bacterium]